MTLPIFNQPNAIDFHPTDFWGFKTTPAVNMNKPDDDGKRNCKTKEQQLYCSLEIPFRC